MAAFSAKAPINQQIEQKAALHPPSVYQLLSFFHALDTESEALQEFIPLTSVQARRPEDVKIFAVGLVPPSAVVTDRLLDRSASIQASDDHLDVGSSSWGDLPGETGGIATSTTVPVGPTITPKSVEPKQQGLNDDFFRAYVVMCNRLGCQPEELARVIQTESAWRPHAKAVRPPESGHVVARGLIQFISKTASGYGITDWETYDQMPAIDQLESIERFYKGRAKGRTAAQLKRITFGGFNNPEPPDGGSLYAQNAVSRGLKRADFQAKAYQQNIASDRDKDGYVTAEDLFGRLDEIEVNPDVRAGIQKAKDSLGMGPNSPFRTEEAPTPDTWVEDGAANANQAHRTASQVADKDLNQTNLGRRYMAAQQATRRVMQAAINQIANTPPLRLLVNPQSFRVSAEKLISSGNWGRNGPIIEHWGENQDKIEGSGKIAAFYSMDMMNATGPGLTRTARQFSASYQNLLSLFLLYKNNGGVWLPDPLVPGGVKVNNLSIIGSVYLYYDEILYIGSFDSLSLSEAEDTPFSLEYSFSFTVRAWYLLDHLDDPQYTYGRPVTPSLPTGAGGSPLSGGNNPQPTPEVEVPARTNTQDPFSPDLEGL